ncbi:gamma-glutamylcyclotransferase family protein [uncultured Pseudokineococcus sp.]|uniref:gamma-glutamylcyclotransferase family protein n=1 Tax=uncultured Pseudokineococcus sp. TaxID=1642928 RepID=UPI002625643D|nr:gamma-glutamylcyclotransferase family protein [uncultured Pseudokineococcus sp.]
MPQYAAYGSNLHPARMAERAPHSPLAGTGWLHGWRLTFGGEDRGFEGALATVVQDSAADAAVYVGLYDLTDADAKALDELEGAGLGLYRKVRVRVDTLSGQVLAWVYVLDAYEGGLPAARYLGMVADAAEAAGAPAEYVTGLRARPCRASEAGGPPPSGLVGGA